MRLEVPESLTAEGEDSAPAVSSVSSVSSAAPSAFSLPRAESPLSQDAQHFQRALFTLQAVQELAPDRFAKARQQSRLLGLPALDVYRMQAEDGSKADGQAQGEEKNHPAQNLLKLAQQGNPYAARELQKYPRTLQALANGEQAAIAQDDISSFAQMEEADMAAQERWDALSFTQKLSASVDGQSLALDMAGTLQGLLENERDTALARYDAMDAQIAQAEQQGKRWNDPEGRFGTSGLVYGQASPERRAQLRQMAGRRVPQNRQRLLDRLREQASDYAALPQDSGERQRKRLIALGQDSLSATWETLKNQPAYGLRTAAGAVVSSVPVYLASLLGGIFAGPSGALAGMASTEYQQEYASRYLEVVQRAGVDLTDAGALLALLNNDALKQQAHEEAQRKAAGTTATDVLLAGVAGRLLAPLKIRGRELTATQRELFNLGVQIPLQAAGEGLSEGVGQYAATGSVDMGEVLLESLAGLAFGGVDVAVFGGHRFADYRRAAQQAKAGSAALEQMAKAAQNSKTLKRDPDSFREIAKQLLSGSRLQRLWLPASALTELNQSGELAPLLERIPGLSEQYREAQATGGELHLETADYLAAFAEHHDTLKDRVRFGELSEAESVEAAQNYADRLQALAETLQKSDKEPLLSLHQQLFGEYLQAGFNRTEAAQYASLQTALYERMEERTGIAVQDLQRRFALHLKTQSLLPPNKSVSDLHILLARLRKGDIPTLRQSHGASLIEALTRAGGIQDEGGELANRDTDVGKRGKNRLSRPDGLLPDAAAEWAHEQGYIQAHDLHQLYAAIDQELEGNPVYSAQNYNETLHNAREQLNALQELIERQGIDLSTQSDDEVLAALSGTVDTPNTQAADNQRVLQQQAIADVIQAARGQGHAPQKAVLGKVADWLVQEAAKHGLNLQGYVHTLDGSAVRHVLNRHGNPEVEKSRGQIALSDADIQSIPQVVQQPDAVVLGTQTKGHKEQIGFIKRLPDGTVLYLEEVRSGKQELAAVSMRKYPATRDFSAIVNSTLPSNARSDSGDGVSVITPPAAGNTRVLEQSAPSAAESAAAQQQYKDTERAHGGRNAYEKAKAAGQTRLTYPQWVQVRTPAFKRWFGDWQAAKGVAQLERLPVPDLSGTPVLEGKKAIEQAFRDFGTVENHSDGRTVTFPAGTAGKIKRHQGVDVGRIAAAFNQLFADAVPMLSEVEQPKTGHKDHSSNVQAYHHYVSPFRMDGIDHYVRFTVYEMQAGKKQPKGSVGENLLHSSFISEVSVYKKSAVSASPSSLWIKAQSLSGSSGSAALADTKLAQWLQAGNPDKVSKAVEPQTGEPRVVYHGTSQDFSTFERSRGKRAEFGDGFYFTSSPERAALYARGSRFGQAVSGGNLMPVFLSLKKTQTGRQGQGAEREGYDGRVVTSKIEGVEETTFIAFHPESIKSATANSGAFDGQNPDIRYQSGAGSKSPRGSIRFDASVFPGQPRRFEIHLAATRDLSTFLHELGHFWLEVVQDVVASGDANAELSADLGLIRGWLKAEDGQALSVEQHEQFARGFEAYLGEGRAPSEELEGAFARFKRWIIGVYKSLTRLNVELSDDIRGVFDRLLTAEKRVQQAQADSGHFPLFKDALAAGMSAEEWAAYAQSLERAHEEASEAVQADITREESAQRKRWWKAKADEVRREVTQEVDAQPIYAAFKALREGVLADGSRQDIKLNSGELREGYGTPATQKLAFLHQKDGLPLSTAALLLGFDSGDALVKSLLGAVPRREAIETETAQRMLKTEDRRQKTEDRRHPRLPTRPPVTLDRPRPTARPRQNTGGVGLLRQKLATGQTAPRDLGLVLSAGRCSG